MTNRMIYNTLTEWMPEVLMTPSHSRSNLPHTPTPDLESMLSSFAFYERVFLRIFPQLSSVVTDYKAQRTQWVRENMRPSLLAKRQESYQTEFRILVNQLAGTHDLGLRELLVRQCQLRRSETSVSSSSSVSLVDRVKPPIQSKEAASSSVLLELRLRLRKVSDAADSTATLQQLVEFLAFESKPLLQMEKGLLNMQIRNVVHQNAVLLRQMRTYASWLPSPPSSSVSQSGQPWQQENPNATLNQEQEEEEAEEEGQRECREAFVWLATRITDLLASMRRTVDVLMRMLLEDEKSRCAGLLLDCLQSPELAQLEDDLVDLVVVGSCPLDRNYVHPLPAVEFRPPSTVAPNVDIPTKEKEEEEEEEEWIEKVRKVVENFGALKEHRSKSNLQHFLASVQQLSQSIDR
jgi:hypothetical protein